MRVLLAGCSGSISVDRNSNRLSVFNVLEELASSVFPAALPPFTFFSLIKREGAEKRDGLIILQLKIDIGETGLANVPVEVDFQGKDRTRNIVEIGGLVVPTPGELTFQLSFGKEILATWPVAVKDRSKLTIRPPAEQQQKGVSNRKKSHSIARKIATRPLKKSGRKKG